MESRLSRGAPDRPISPHKLQHGSAPQVPRVSSTSTDPPYTPSETPLVKSTSRWYADGSIVIQAEENVWKVHRCLIAERAGGFLQDLLNEALPGELYEGAPLMKTQDTAEEMGLFLETLYNSGDFGAFREEPQDLNTAMVLARLASKYCADGMFFWAMRPITRIYGAATLAHYLLDAAPVLRGWELAKQSEHHIAIINLARRCDLPELLPVAFYLAARSLTTREALFGVSSPRGAVKFDHQEDMERCIEGRARLLAVFPRVYLRLSNVNPDNFVRSWCKGRVSCWETLGMTEHNAFLSGLPAQSGCSASAEHMVGCPTVPYLESLEVEVDTLLRAGSICTPCAEYGKGVMQRQQEEMWNALPIIFNLPARST